MLKRRIIPIVLIDGFSVLKTVNFNTRRNLGSPITVMRTYETRDVDELIMLDIDASNGSRVIDKWIISEISKDCFMPLTIGGGIRDCNDIEKLLIAGADKVAINSSSLDNPNFIAEAVLEFGSQCIVCSVDILNNKIYSKNRKVNLSIGEHLDRMQDCDIGEFLFCDVDREGTLLGPNLKLAKKLKNLVKKPCVFSGGVATPDHCSDLITIAQVDAVACSSIFHFSNFTPQDCRNALSEKGIPVRRLDEISQ